MPVDYIAAVEAAIRAPSLHNTQPWRFRMRQDGPILGAGQNHPEGHPQIDQAVDTLTHHSYTCSRALRSRAVSNANSPKPRNHPSSGCRSRRVASSAEVV